MTSRLEEIIEEIENYIANCKTQPLNPSKIIVNREEIEELLTELRMKTPDEIKRYQKIISNKDAILADAQAKADQIIEAAEVHTSELVSEHQIMQQAYAQANEIVMIATNQAQEILDKATEDANNYRTAAIEYTDNLLGNLEDIISHAVSTSKAKYDSLLTSLKNCQDIVVANRAELHPEEAATEDETSNVSTESEAEEGSLDDISIISSGSDK